MSDSTPVKEITLTIEAEVPRSEDEWRGWMRIRAAIGQLVRTEFGVTARPATPADHAKALGLDAETLEIGASSAASVYMGETATTLATAAKLVREEAEEGSDDPH